jgi:N-acetylglucosaminyldiphosphoundecaprenol N-acetyl-beta-D-mannosaminyltransferase
VNREPIRATGDCPFPSIRLLGARIDCLRLPDLLLWAHRTIRGQKRATVFYVNVHCMNVRHRDPEYRRILEVGDVVYCDGTGVRLAAYLQGIPIPVRLTGADWVQDVCRMAVRERFSLFLLGGLPGVASSAAASLQVRYPGLRIVGCAAGFEAGEGVVRQINQVHPDILLVGMGSPTQEKWIATHRDELDVSLVWAVGALFDFVSGRIRRGPRWMTDNGLEWLCRLAVEPRKLWRRYLLGNPWFLWRVIRHAPS